MPNDKAFHFTLAEITALDRAIREIVSAAAKKVSSPMPAFSARGIAVPVKASAEAPLAAVAEDNASDIENWKDRLKKKTGPGKSQFSPGEAEDALTLRQRYYGPEGEIEKARLAKKVKPEKGIGELSPEEFESAGYVIKVPAEVLADFDVMVKELRDVGAIYEQARSWYHEIKKLLLQVAGNDRDAALYGLLIATFSPRAKFSINLAEATFMFKAIVADAKKNAEKLREYAGAFRGEGGNVKPEEKTRHIGHLKVANFSLNLIKPDLAGKPDKETGEMEYNEEFRWSTTCDVWIVTAFYPLLKRASTAGEWAAQSGKLMGDPMTYSYLSELVARKAKQFNLLPHELQAIIWVAMKKRQSGEDAATTDDSFRQIEEAIKNIHGIRKDLAEIEAELKKGSWAGTISKDIDERGLKAASDVVLGQKIVDPETGKVTSKIPGVRGIAMSGKKGDSFRYFPDDEKDPGPKADRRVKVAKGEVPKEKPALPYEDERFSDLATFWVLNNVVMMPTGKLGNLGSTITMYLSDGFSTDSAAQTIISDFDRTSKTAAGFLEQLSESRLIAHEGFFKKLLSAFTK